MLYLNGTMEWASHGTGGWWSWSSFWKKHLPPPPPEVYHSPMKSYGTFWIRKVIFFNPTNFSGAKHVKLRGVCNLICKHHSWAASLFQGSKLSVSWTFRGRIRGSYTQGYVICSNSNQEFALWTNLLAAIWTTKYLDNRNSPVVLHFFIAEATREDLDTSPRLLSSIHVLPLTFFTVRNLCILSHYLPEIDGNMVVFFNWCIFFHPQKKEGICVMMGL